MKRLGSDSKVQNRLFVDSFENARGFLSELIPYKILETILCQNFAKKIDFMGSFSSLFSVEVWKGPKRLTATMFLVI